MQRKSPLNSRNHYPPRRRMRGYNTEGSLSPTGVRLSITYQDSSVTKSLPNFTKPNMMLHVHMPASRNAQTRSVRYRPAVATVRL